ncbi:MAG: hypothetical protein J1E60_00515 [Christensenellaceae bacterium]|nr:hypothetical protein [Christensenellaceae bacterium]
MVSIVRQLGHSYEFFNSGVRIGCISVRRNPFHAQNCYLDLNLEQYDPAIARELFELLSGELACPLQAMLHSRDEEKCAFLTSGGFERKRRCYEMEVTAAELKTSVKEDVLLTEILPSDTAYRVCCELLYNSYVKTHEAVSPLTASKEQFYNTLPGTVLLREENGEIVHFAFTEGNEIAYVGTVSQSDFHSFAQALLSRMLTRYDSIAFECDDCDPSAMELKAFFCTRDEDSYDTYILD